MVSLEEQEKIVFLNSQYQDNKELIDRLQSKLLHNVSQLNLSTQDLKDTQDYLQDKVNLFRFLKKENFDMDSTHQELLKTVEWRLDMKISDLTYTDSIDFYKEPLAYYHNEDVFGRPILFVRLEHFPRVFTNKEKKLIQHVQDIACLIMEMGRKLTWNKTCETHQLVSQFTVVVNLKKAPLIPVDPTMIQWMGVLLEQQFPNIISHVNILNFSWIYQGVWSVVKYLLSQEAKESIKFTTVQDLMPYINPDAIIQEMGGNDRFEWSLANDTVLEKYGSGRHVELPNTPPLSDKDRSRSNSFLVDDSISNISRSDSSSDVFFDANDALPSTPITPPITTDNNLTMTPRQLQPTDLTMTTSPRQLQITTEPTDLTMTTTSLPNQLQQQTIDDIPSGIIIQANDKTPKHVTSSCLGLRMGVDFLTSFIDTQQDNKKILFTQKEEPDDDVIVVNTQPQLTKEKPTWLNYYVQRIIQVTITEQRGWMYWAIMYFLLRGPIESVIYKTVMRTPIHYKKPMTIGITATIAAILGSSFSDVILKYTRQ